MNVTPEHVLAGLANADRETLSTFLALYDDATLPKLLWDQGTDAYRWIASKVSDEERQDVQKAFGERVSEKSAAIADSDATDANLRLRLWMNLRAGLRLDPDLTFSRPGVADVTEDVGKRVAELFAEQLDDEAAKKSSFFSKEYWTEHANRRLNPFSKEKWPTPAFPDVVQQNILRIVAGAAERGELDDELKGELVGRVRKTINSVDDDVREEILEGLGVDDLSEQAALRLLVGGGGLAGLGIAVEMAGFAAYILAAKASALIPLIGGKTLISSLAVVANPLFIIPVILGGGLWMAASIRSKMCGAFSVVVASILALKAVAESSTDPSEALKVFEHLPDHVPAELIEEAEAARAEPESTLDEALALGKKVLDSVVESVSADEYPDLAGYLTRYRALGGK